MKKHKKEIPGFMLIYRCAVCNQESGYTENEKPVCRYCEKNTEMILVSRQKISAEVMSARLKQLTDNILKNLESAFESMTEEDKKAFAEDSDAEKEMLLLLAKAKQFRDNVHNFEMKEPENKKSKKKKTGDGNSGYNNLQ